MQPRSAGPGLYTLKMICPVSSRPRLRLFLLALIVAPHCLLAAPLDGAQAPQLPRGATHADAIFYNGTILTGKQLESTPEHITAMALRDGVIIAIGSDDTILQLRDVKTSVVDLKGAFAMPGLNDAHTHLGLAGRQKMSVDLDGVRSLDELKARVQSAAAKAAPGTWLQGGGWDHTKWSDPTLPSARDLDSVTGDHPAFLERTDGHIGVANSLALAAAGLDASSRDPQGGQFDHASGAGSRLTGIVRDTAMGQILSHIRPPTSQQRREALSLALADAAAHGLTSVQDNSDWDDFLALESLEREGKMPVRVSEWLAFSDPVSVLLQHRSAHAAADRMLHTGMLKGFMDGSLGSRTAALNEPYSDDPKNSGLTRYKQANLDDMTTERVAAGFQIGFHAIGDRAVEMALNAFQQAEAAHPEAKALRPRIEHSQVLGAGDFKRYHQLGVIASMQPNHLLTDRKWAEDRLGPARARYSYAWNSFLKAGVPLAFGTDYPVEPITPFRGLYAAVTRQGEQPPGVPYFPAERVTIAQALSAYTQGSAYAEKTETYKGQLLVGFVADFVVLDRDLLAIPPREILNTQVLRTVVGGKTVYEGQPDRTSPAP